MIAEDHFDFGEVFEDRQLIHSFVIKNSGNAPLEILQGGPGLRLHRGRLRADHPAGGQGEITLSHQALFGAAPVPQGDPGVDQ